MRIVVPKIPVDAGLPEEFASWRRGQKEAAELCLNSPERIKVFCAPTGFGKSALAIVIALLSERPTVIVTWNKGLMDQYLDQFRSIGMVDLRGRDNYKCDLRSMYTCEDGSAAFCHHQGTVRCPYSLAEMQMAVAKLGLTNYSKWTAGTRLNVFGHFTQVIFDEAHHLPDAIVQAMRVELHHKRIEDLGLSFPRGMDAEDLSHWKKWASVAADTLHVEMERLREMIKGADPKLSWIRQLNYLRRLSIKLTILRTLRPPEWVVDILNDERGYSVGYQFEPIWTARYGESTIFRGVESIVCLSSIIRPKTLVLSGIPRVGFRFTDLPSSFSPRRAPIYYIPTVRVDARSTDMSPLWIAIDQFIARRQDRNGVIHTVSFGRQKQVIEHSRFRSSMIINQRGSPIGRAIRRFQREGGVLVSPSVDEGFNFIGDMCRWQIMTKIPFEPPSKIVKARQEEDKEYRGFQALQRMINAFGRGMREEKDWCEGAIFDQHMDWFWGQHKHLAAPWFTTFLETRQIMPNPLDPEDL